MSRSLWLVGLVLLVFSLMSACATSSKDQSASGQTPGLYKNEDVGFTLTYPDMFKMDKTSGDEVFRAYYPNQWKIPNISISVADTETDELNSKQYMDAVKEANPGTKRFKVLSEKDMTLKDGTPAKSFAFKWNWTDGVTKLQSGTVIAIKGDKYVSCIATTVLGGETDVRRTISSHKMREHSSTFLVSVVLSGTFQRYPRSGKRSRSDFSRSHFSNVNTSRTLALLAR